MTIVSDISNGRLSVIINPFGEAYPELGNGEGVGFKTIASYIRDDGIQYQKITLDCERSDMAWLGLDYCIGSRVIMYVMVLIIEL
jgi:hypothetical protein